MKIRKARGNIQALLKRTEIQEFLHQYEDFLGCSQERNALRRLPKAKWERVISNCEKILLSRGVGLESQMDIRLIAVEVLVGALPESLEKLQNLLRLQGNKDIYEVHFSLFVVLDSFIELKCRYGRIRRLRACYQQIHKIAKEYLLNVASETALAAWKVGESLGNHWKWTDSLPILEDAGRNARYVAGREAALTGLEDVLRKIREFKKRDKNKRGAKTTIKESYLIEGDKMQMEGLDLDEVERAILTTAKEIARKDRSEGVRYYAERLSKKR